MLVRYCFWCGPRARIRPRGTRAMPSAVAIRGLPVPRAAKARPRSPRARAAPGARPAGLHRSASRSGRRGRAARARHRRPAPRRSGSWLPRRRTSHAEALFDQLAGSGPAARTVPPGARCPRVRARTPALGAPRPVRIASARHLHARVAAVRVIHASRPRRELGIASVTSTSTKRLIELSAGPCEIDPAVVLGATGELRRVAARRALHEHASGACRPCCG